MHTPTREERLAHMVRTAGAVLGNAADAIPGTEGHGEPWEPWSAPVMILAGCSPDGRPWLYLAARCGWWIGFSPQHDPAKLAEIAAGHRECCEACAGLAAQ